MNTFVPMRKKRLLSLAVSVPYTIEELEVLNGLIGETSYEWRDKFATLSADMYWFVDEESKGLLDITRDDSDSKWGNDPKQKINFLQYLLVYELRVYLFLMCVPQNEVIMYINDKYLALFAKWRLLISK